jgi:hypothetical protein
MKNLKLIFGCTCIMCLVIISPCLFLNKIIRVVGSRNIHNSTYKFLQNRSDSLYKYTDSITKIK